MNDPADFRIDYQAILRSQVPDPLRMQVPVTMRALQQRINRRLAKESQALKKTRGGRALQNLGTYYVLDTFNNTVVMSQADPVLLAKDLQVLSTWEMVEEEQQG